MDPYSLFTSTALFVKKPPIPYGRPVRSALLECNQWDAPTCVREIEGARPFGKVSASVIKLCASPKTGKSE